jgi:hypothetical protein
MFTLTRNHNNTKCCKNQTKKKSREFLWNCFTIEARENNKNFKVYVHTIHTFYCLKKGIENTRYKQNQKLIDLLSDTKRKIVLLSTKMVVEGLSLFSFSPLTSNSLFYPKDSETKQKTHLKPLERSEILEVITHSVKSLKYIMITCSLRAFEL